VASQWWGCQVPPKPARGVSTPSANRAARALHLAPSGLFHPDNALELPPSGLCSPHRSSHVSATSPPMPLGAVLRQHLGFEGLIPARIGTRQDRSPDDPCPLDATPSEALPPAAVAPASRNLLSRASRVARTEAPTPHCTTESHRTAGPVSRSVAREQRNGTGPSGVCHLVAS